MIGDEYLQARAQLGTALFSLSTLAHGLRAGRDVLRILQDLRNGLREPFILLAAGGEKAGKSTLINALFGREVVPAEGGQEGDRIHLYNYGPQDGDEVVYGQFVEHTRRSTLLRDFNIVDTPDSASITHEQLAIADRILPVADLVLFVFGVNDPWNSQSWDFLGHISARPPRNIVFILQQCDLRDPVEVEAITAHVEQRVREKFPEKCRVFAVSAKKAYLSKTEAADPGGLFRESNFGALESYINETVTQSAERMDGLRAACRAAQTILRDVAVQTRGEHEVVMRDADRLEEWNHDLRGRRDQAAKQAGGVQWAVAQAYDRLQKHGEDLLLLGPAKRGSREEKLRPPVDEKMEETIPSRIRAPMEMLEGDLRTAWPQLHDTLRKRFPEENLSQQTADLIRERTNLLQQIELSLTQKRSPKDFQKQVGRIFSGLCEWLQVTPETISIEGLAAFIPVLARKTIDDFYAAYSAATAMQGKFSGLGKANRIAGQFRAEIMARREDLLGTLDTHLRSSTVLFYKELSTVFEPLEKFCARQRMIYEPRLALVKQMEEILAKTGGSLGLAAPAPELQPA